MFRLVFKTGNGRVKSCAVGSIPTPSAKYINHRKSKTMSIRGIIGAIIGGIIGGLIGYFGKCAGST